MIIHSNLWDSFDEIAESKNISASCLARTSGLCSTAFNKSKRTDKVGKERFPSTGTLLKVLNSYDMTMTEFGRICDAFAAKNNKKQK